MIIDEWVDGTFDAAHQRPYGDRVHGHTWFVRVFWNSDGRDARAMQVSLDTILLHGFDHRLLDEVADLEPSNAGVAKAVATLMGDLITEVWVWRKGRVACGCRLRR